MVSDRGNIKELKASQALESLYDVKPIDKEPTPLELRLQKLYDYSKQHNDTNLMAASGFITTDYIADKNALPLSVYRLRKTIDDIKSRSGSTVNEWTTKLTECFPVGLRDALIAEERRYKSLIKTASKRKPPVFWRVEK